MNTWGQGMDCENWCLVDYLKREISLLGQNPPYKFLCHQGPPKILHLCNQRV